MYFGSLEERKSYITNRAAYLRDAAGTINRVKEVVKKFDGKVYNCRFDEAISDLTDDRNRFYVSNSYGWFYLYCYKRGTNLNNAPSLLTGYSCKADQIKDQTREEYKIFDGKRIKADAMIEGLNRSRERLLQEAFELENAAADLDNTLQMIGSLKNAINSLICGLPYTVQDACGLKRVY